MSLSNEHEALVKLFEERPLLAVDLLTQVPDLPVPAHSSARSESAALTDCQPKSYSADNVVSLVDEAGSPVLAVITEIQNHRDDDKFYSWPVYQTTLRARLRCQTIVMVVSPSRPVARWAARTIELDPTGSQVKPVVIGPDALPYIKDADEATGNLELTVLSAMAHGGETDGVAVLEALARAMSNVGRAQSEMYADLVYGVLPGTARKILEDLMSTWMDYRPQAPWNIHWMDKAKAEGKAEGEVKGEAKGEAKSILKVLRGQGIDVPESARDRILGCTDIEQLDVWFDRALTATSVEDLFGE